jgi:hypothetical protein
MSTTASVESALRRMQALSPRLGRVVRYRSGAICFGAVIVFVVICLLAQWLRHDLDWREDPLSHYLTGHYGGWVRAAYYELSLSLMLLGAGLYATLVPKARSSVPMLLLALAGCSLIVTAISETDLPLLNHAAEDRLHKLAALTTFLSVTTAMMVQSWRFLLDGGWRARFRLMFPLAVATFIALLVYAFWHEPPEGLRQKSVISMILLWLGFAAWWLRGRQRMPEPIPGKAQARERAPPG